MNEVYAIALVGGQIAQMVFFAAAAVSVVLLTVKGMKEKKEPENGK